MTALARYDAACAALSAAVKADEVMHVRLEAKAIEAVARVAKNLDLELDAAKLRIRAEARLGVMLKQAEEQGIVARHGGNNRKQDSESETCSRVTLKEIGVDPKLSSQARKLADEGVAERVIARLDEESRNRGRVVNTVVQDELGKRNAASRRQLARELSDASAELSPHGRMFGCLYADPAWSRKAGIGNRAYENHYGTMTWQQILDMPVKQRLLPDAWGFVWMPRAHLLAAVEIEMQTSLGMARVKVPLAWAIMIQWGFDSYSTCSVWTKTDDEFPDDQGTGLIFYDQDELLLVFKRGRGLPKPDTDKKHGSNHRARSGRHSEKPAFYRDMINDMTGTVPTLELFAREDGDHVLPPNFFTWGNQSKNTAEIACDEEFAADTGEIYSETISEAELLRGLEDRGFIPPSVSSVSAEIAGPPTSVEPAPDIPPQGPPSGAGSPLSDDDLEIPEFLRRPLPEHAETHG